MCVCVLLTGKAKGKPKASFASVVVGATSSPAASSTTSANGASAPTAFDPTSMMQLFQKWFAQQVQPASAQQATQEAAVPTASSSNSQTNIPGNGAAKPKAAAVSAKAMAMFAQTVQLAKAANPSKVAQIEQQYQGFLQERASKQVNDLPRLVQLYETAWVVL